MTETLLVIHILSAAAWIGGSLLLGFVSPRMASAGAPAAGAWLGVVKDVVPKYFIPVALLTLVSGMTIVMAEDSWSWGDPFVGIGIAAVVVALAIALGNNLPSLTRMQAAAGEGDMVTVGANAKRIKLGGSAIMIILILTEIVMVLRLGA